MANKELTPKQRMFVSEYVVSLNATQAAISAGYSKETAQQQGSRLLLNVVIKKEIDNLLKKADEKSLVTVDYIVNGLKTVADRCMQGVEVFDKLGHATGMWEFDSSGANKALQLLGQYKNIFNEENKDKNLLSGAIIYLPAKE